MASWAGGIILPAKTSPGRRPPRAPAPQPKDRSLTSPGSASTEGVAIVGVAARFPGAPDAGAFWRNLEAGVESVRFFSEEELRAAGVNDTLLANPAYVRAGAPLEDIDRFDAALFNFTPREAALLDPQARLLMECVLLALEDAGYAPGALPGPVGLYAGVGPNAYFARNVLPGATALDPAGAYQAMLANEKDFVPTWISYKLDLRGPSMAVQTSCSTSLVAVHVACQALLAFECDAAVAGGASIAVEPGTGYVHQEGGILSPDGHCRPFDAAARGTVRGSGAGVVVLRRLADALEAGEPILAVIRGSAVNNDGAVKVGFTAPGVSGQEDVIALAQAVAGVTPDSIGLVEGHGTATPLGDPIEVAALTRVFRRSTAARGYCALGSVKSNFGHLDAAAGVAGLIKAALAVHHGRIPPTLHFQAANPKLQLETSPFFVNATAVPWPALPGPRRAGVSSFGIGGTNAHVVLEQAPGTRPPGLARARQVIALSARTQAALETATDRLVESLDGAPAVALADVAATLLLGRSAREHRRAVVVADLDEAADALDERDASRVLTSSSPARERPVTFLFPGQGSDYAGMGRELYASEEVFRREVDEAAAALRPLLGHDVRDVMLKDTAPAEVAEAAVFVTDLALARLLLAYGVKPQSLIGHSVGEYVAACLAGVMDDAGALGLLAARARLMKDVPAGAMLAVAAAEASVRRLLPPTGISVALVNAPSSCVVAGTPEAVDELVGVLDGAGIAHRRLAVAHAFHSHLMDAALPRFRDHLATVTLRPPRIPFVSNVTGTWIRAEEACDPEYWVRQVRRTVVFADGLRELLKDADRVCVEVGPGRTLSTLCRQQQAPSSSQVAVALLPDAREKKDATGTFLGGLARLWVAGVPVDWRPWFAGETRNRVRLPGTVFERERFWIDPPAAAAPALDPARRLPAAEWLSAPAWRQAPLPPAPARPETSGPWLLVADAFGVAAAVEQALLARGEEFVTVPHEDDADWAPRVAACRRVLHLGGLGPARDARAGVERLMALAQAVAALGERRPELLLVTSGVQAVTGVEELEPEKAAVVGLAAVLRTEVPGLRCRHVDVALDDVARVAEQVLAEALADDHAPLVAWRGRRRFVLDHVAVAAEAPLRLRPRGVYWITGGFGGLGLAVARHLARTVQARLVLTGRASVPPREAWDAPGHDAATTARLAAVRELEAAGAEVLALAADVTDGEALGRVAAEIRARFGALHGVVHAAGVAGGRMLARHDVADARRVMAPKSRGGAAVLEAAAPFAPDFVAFTSSLAVLLGGPGQASYAAGNAVLDALARAAEPGPTRVVSVAFDRWRDVGMARGAGGTSGLGAEEGVATLLMALATGCPEVVVSTTPLAPRLEAARAPQAAPAARAAHHPRPSLATTYVAPGTDDEARLAEIWQGVLGVAPVGVDDNFFELGGDSLTALSFTAAWKGASGVPLPVTALYEAPTIRALLQTRSLPAPAGHPQGLIET